MSQITLAVLKELEVLGGCSYLPQLHHFSSNKFRSSPPSFKTHKGYSAGTDESKGGENEQTRKRIKAAIELVKSGSSWDEAIVASWIRFPILTR